MSDISTVARLTSALADRYTVMRELGAGGMATVYLAHDIKHERDVAIKVLHPDLGAALGADRFLSEIKTTAKLQHPHILPLLDSGAADGLLYYVMPFVRGETLRARLEREKQLPIDDALRIAREVASALEHAHKQGIIHRDIKPENILLQDGAAVVADFGIALAVQSAGGQRLTQTGLSLGTPQYMSPEQAMGERTLDARTDVYSLGAVTYEMLTGDPPFTGSSTQAIVAKVLTERPTALRIIRDTVPEFLESAVFAALAKLPADRPESARRFAERLGGVKVGEESTTGTGSQGRRPTRVRDRRFGIGALGMTACIVALVTAVPWIWARPSVATSAGVHPVRFTVSGPPGTVVRGQQDAVSPDGQAVVFGAIGADTVRRLYVRRLDDIEPLLLEGTERARDMAISPSGEWLAFFRGNELLKSRLTGGSPVVISRFATAQGTGLAWADSLQIVLSWNGRIATVSANGGTPANVVVADSVAAWSVILPEVLEDGRTVLAVRWNGTATLSSLISMDLTNGRVSDLGVFGTMPLGVVDRQLIFCSPAGALAAAPYNASGSATKVVPVQLLTDVRVSSNRCTVAIARSGVMVSRTRRPAQSLMQGTDLQATELVVTADAAIAAARFSPDLRLIGYGITNADGSTSIQVFDRALNTSRRISTLEGTVVFQGFTPDSKRVVFRFWSASTPDSELWWQPIDGGPAERLLAIRGQRIVDGMIAPNGKDLVYQTRSGANSSIWVQRLGSQLPPRPLAGAAHRDQEPAISPDGAWIAFVSDESGAREVYVTPFAGGTRYRVSLNGGEDPIWTRDGRSLYYKAGTPLLVARLTTGASFTVTSRDTVMRRSTITVNGHANYDIAPDGSVLFVASRTTRETDVVVELDWHSTFRRLVSASGVSR